MRTRSPIFRSLQRWKTPAAGVIRAAVIQAAAPLFDAAAAVQRIEALAVSAAEEGARLIVFPEA
ncbi:MAG: nitrilase-related carbon-nitrogen hydrolase, partial [Hyphococcus sp.]